jgi:hypothetical protein
MPVCALDHKAVCKHSNIPGRFRDLQLLQCSSSSQVNCFPEGAAKASRALLPTRYNTKTSLNIMGVHLSTTYTIGQISVLFSVCKSASLRDKVSNFERLPEHKDMVETLYNTHQSEPIVGLARKDRGLHADPASHFSTSGWWNSRGNVCPK